MRGFLPDQTRLSQLQLRTRSLERALEFYVGVLGLAASHQSESKVALSANQNGFDLLVLSEDPNASPRPKKSIGLYHFALRYSTRHDLAHAYRRLLTAEYPVDGASDHGVSEAIYLTDPDGNGVELYADRPQPDWPWQKDHLSMLSTPLDLDNLLATPPSGIPNSNSPPQPELGHIHLHVADLRAAERFYSEYLGLTVTQRSYRGALFFAAGDYHHHIAANLWAGKASPPANSVGLVSYRIEVPVAEILYCLKNRAPLLGYETRVESSQNTSPVLQIRDPNGTWLEVQVSPNPVALGFCAQYATCQQ